MRKHHEKHKYERKNIKCRRFVLIIKLYILALNLIYIRLKFSKIIKVCCFILLVGCSLTKSQYHEFTESSHVLIFEQYGQDFNEVQNKLMELNSFLSDEFKDEQSIYML